MEEEARKIFAGTAVNIMIEGQRHLGAVVGLKDYKDQYCSSKVTKWTDESKSLMQVSISSKTIPPRDKPPGHDSKGAKTLPPGQ